MDFKFIFIVLVISAARGKETIQQKLISPGVYTSLPLDTIKSFVASNASQVISHEEATTGVLKNIKSKIPVQDSKEVSPDEVKKTTEESVIHDITSKTAIDSKTTATGILATTATPKSVTITPPVTDSEGKWIVKNETGGVCIFAQMELQFNLTYIKSSNIQKNVTIFVPKNSTVRGNCSDSIQRLRLIWDKENSFGVDFGLNKTSNKFEIILLNLTINGSIFNLENTSLVYVSHKSGVPAIPVKMSYRCDKEQMQVLNATTNQGYAKMFMRHTQLEAFMTKKNASFSEAKDCEAFETPDIVPVAVGCVLSVLVLIVLVAYMIGRRRSQSRGYLSM